MSVIKPKPWISVARISIELCSPMLIATGQAEDDFDANILRDANELPMIPGTSIAGVISHMAKEMLSEDVCELLGDIENRSCLYVSSAVVHNSNNQACEGLITDLEEDALLNFLQQSEPLSRDRVALNERGVAVDKGKYDFVAIPSGARFSFELKLQTQQQHTQQWQKILSLLVSAQFRLGQKTRSGLGKIKLLDCYEFTANLMDLSAQQSFKKLSKYLSNTAGMQVLSLDNNEQKKTSSTYKTYQLDVQAEGGLRIGQGNHAFDYKSSKPADALIWSEPCIQWTLSEQGSVNKHQRVIPASGIKGALSHRTLYHYRRLTGDYIKETGSNRAKEFEHLVMPDALQPLFGIVTQDNSISARAGRLIIDDIYLSDNNLQVVTQQHNSIDRFTGGTREHVLFAEEIL